MRALDIIDVNFWIVSISEVSKNTYIYKKLLRLRLSHVVATMFYGI